MMPEWAASSSLECEAFFPKIHKKEYFTPAHIHLQESITQIYFPFIDSIILQKGRKTNANNILRK